MDFWRRNRDMLIIFTGAYYLLNIVDAHIQVNRKILINYPKRQVGNKIYGGESSHLPLKINTAGVIPAIFGTQSLYL